MSGEKRYAVVIWTPLYESQEAIHLLILGVNLRSAVSKKSNLKRYAYEERTRGHEGWIRKERGVENNLCGIIIYLCKIERK